MNGTLDSEKRALRAELRERRQQRSAASLEEAAAGVQAQLDRLVHEHAVRSMSCFLSTTTEPGTREFIAAAVARGIRVLLPVTRADGLLDWAVAEDEGLTAEGMFGLPEPVGELLSPVAVNDVDLLVIPAAAVDRTGMRLGWGRGYFDKTIGSMEKCPPVYAVIFDSELLDEVPRDLHDQPVSGVVTPTRTLTLPAR
ncbi:5-formyltetrahydrofolate cyclo-ligase [Microbacterium sp. EYE_5]|uniref:5-formyltetrahydrofolate cyclo-ligase n=1 Tax=unclassified Microbacterium TaxID=2609290 RepID=UPI0020040992|nr:MULTISPECIES: 5-formyltetrahydrofolate cyclo-ligase [unclassified Microbacterium]MCK6081225.1 5-formyltetrahydrofolate cyclo-ligase [Microbacterium sp. EYE_382]MCK6086495.1 5-formyltetrahydrofolate cyclo-ligase [Microbacterium sp. EYE_384]MCK6124007.1 5-formyltetrahydrofolate cyclo-ligase [Microbacterium sp. EYE_80]MCK6126916.1 5-formyltetrahydrofolate cyclo-ligase [Microbacterium sp. EYE_79]MCK6142180.1 5-formyltetrahydrofolate cyclo-ligase [Microbacterium sp. EYE_39]